MFKELKSGFFLNKEAGLYLRFDNRALLEIEESGINCLEILRACRDGGKLDLIVRVGLGSCLDDKNITDKISVDKIIGGIKATFSERELSAAVYKALCMALPESGGTETGEHDDIESREPDMSLLKTWFCDVMGRTEAEFWNSTLREVNLRWERFAEFQGYLKPVKEIREFDEE